MAGAEGLEIRLTSDPGWLRVLRAAVRQVGELAGLDPEGADGLVVAVDEACANIIVHGYGGKGGQPILATFTLHPDRLEVRLRDFGRKMAPDAIRPLAPDASRPGGLGVALIHRCVDEVMYAPAEGAGMELTLVKHRPQVAEGPVGSARA
jgi:anti-sigma regulatory factor (Ser/Thr protein kinase)